MDQLCTYLPVVDFLLGIQVVPLFDSFGFG